MPKMKTKSAAKKRFSFTASGRVKAGPAGKRHGMIKRSTKFVRDASGAMIVAAFVLSPDGYRPEEIPYVFLGVLARFIR